MCVIRSEYELEIIKYIPYMPRIINLISYASECVRELLTLYPMSPSMSDKVSEMFGGVAVLASSISQPAEFVKPPGPKNP